MVAYVHNAKVATRSQLQKRFFSRGGRSRCQERLTLLVRRTYLDRLPRSSVNQPVVYTVSGRSAQGLRLLRELLGLRVKAVRAPFNLTHTLAVVDCQVQFETAAKAAGYRLKRCLNERELQELTLSAGLRPDAYFELVRRTPEGERTAAFALEAERSGKGLRTLTDRIRRLGDFYYGGHYERAFGTRALRVLYLVGSDYGISPERWIEDVLEIAERLEVTILRFAPLDYFLALDPAEVLFAPIWRKPGEPSLVSLFEYPEEAQDGG